MCLNHINIVTLILVKTSLKTVQISTNCLLNDGIYLESFSFG